jgi:hypothetical protein
MNAVPPNRRRSPRAPRALWGLALALVALALVPPALAQAGLYGPEAPANAAWVRAVNAGAPGGIAVRLASGGAEVLAFGHATRYVLVEPGEVSVDVGGEVVRFEVGPESFTTVAATPDGVVVVTDPALRDISRGLLGLLNLTGREALDLRVPDGTVVLAAVPPGVHDAIAVAQATTELVVTDGDAVVARLDARTYERGVAHTVLVLETEAGVAAFVLTAIGE